MSNDDITSIYQDKAQNIWIGTYSGLNLFNPKTKTFKHFFYQKDKDYLPEHHIFAITGDNNGNLLLGTEGGLISFVYRTRKYIRYKHDNANVGSIGDDNIHALLKTPDGRVWVATAGKGLDLFNTTNNTFSHFIHQVNNSKSIINNNVLCMTQGGNNRLWIGTEQGLDIFDEETGIFERYNKEDGKPERSVNSIFTDQGILWAGVFNLGLIKYDNYISSFARYYKHNNLPGELNNNNINAFAETSDGFWIGTDGGGINYFDKKQVPFQTTRPR